MQRHSGSAELQEEACSALFSVAANNPDNCAALVGINYNHTLLSPIRWLTVISINWLVISGKLRVPSSEEGAGGRVQRARVHRSEQPRQLRRARRYQLLSHIVIPYQLADGNHYRLFDSNYFHTLLSVIK